MRLFSVPRRRAHVVDILTPFVYGVDLYRIKWATNFDVAVPTTIIDSSNIGYLDPAVPQVAQAAYPTSGRQVRIIFDPASFSIPPDVPIWLQLARVVGGAETDVSPMTLLLPENAHHGVGAVVIAGNAPSGTDVGDSLQIDLPLMSDIRFDNHGATGDPFLYVATVPGGPEVAVPPTVDSGQVPLTLMGTESTLLVRGDSAIVAFSAVLTLAFPK
jgi:hypothetical protein